MPNLLLIDTSSAICSVALLSEGKITVRQSEGPRAHGRFLLPAINGCLEEYEVSLDDLDSIAVVAGPGSFTGIRIGIGVVQGLAAALEIPVILVSSLEWHAYSAIGQKCGTTVTVCKQAREGECYIATYQQNLKQKIEILGQESVVAAAAIRLPEPTAQAGKWVAVGDGWAQRDCFAASLLARFDLIDPAFEADIPSLGKLALIKLREGKAVAAELALPNYLKENMHYRTAE